MVHNIQKLKRFIFWAAQVNMAGLRLVLENLAFRVSLVNS